MRPHGARALICCACSLMLSPALLPAVGYAQTPERSTSTFQQRLEGQSGALPVFARPLSAPPFGELATTPDPTTTGSNPERQTASEEGKKTGPVKALKKLLVPSAEAAQPPDVAAEPARTGPLWQRNDLSPPAQADAAPPPRPSDPTPAAANPEQPVAQASVPSRRQKGSGSDAQPSKRKQLAGRPLGAGRAAWYQHPGRTASGETFNPNQLTAAHRTLPFGTRVRVVNKHNGRSVIVRINDRVAKKADVTIDLSRQSARVLGIEGIGSVALYKVN